ncbi:MAG: tetratricopeptide repeat protein [Lewinellaceae bacterium]|nr:tetratricopeptide repeat protein [Lewinellaceae bacterium]
MKNTIFIFLFLCYLLPISAQQSSISGVVTMHNSKFDKGKIEYVSLAQVEEEFGRSQATLTDSEGFFNLMLVGIAEKEQFRFTVTKKSLQVVNLDDLTAIAGQKELIKISMASPEYLADFRRTIYKVGVTNAEKKLALKMQRVEDALEREKEKNKTNQKEIVRLQEEFDRLLLASEKIEEQAQELADKYAKVNLDEVSPQYEIVFRHFQAGDFEKAFISLSEVNLTAQTQSILTEQKKINQVRQVLGERDSILKVRTKETIQFLHLKKDLHYTNYEIDSVEATFDLLLKLDSSNFETLIEYAEFLRDNNRQEAIHFYKKALNLTNNGPKIAHIYYKLALEFENNNKYDLAEKAFLDAANITYELTKNNNDGFGNKLYEVSGGVIVVNRNARYFLDQYASIQGDLGYFYQRQNLYDKALEAYLKALKIYSNVDSPKYKMLTASALINIGDIQLMLGANEKAKEYFLTAIKIFEQNTNLKGLQKALTKFELGELFLRIEAYQKAEIAYLDAINIYSSNLDATNKFYIEPTIASIQFKLGNLFSNMDDYSKAIKFYWKAAEVYENLVKLTPGRFEPQLADVLSTLGKIYVDQGDHNGAYRTLPKASQIYLRLVKNNPNRFEPDAANCYFHLGIFYRQLNYYNLAIDAYALALDIYERLAEALPDQFEPQLARTQHNLGALYGLNNAFNESEAMLLNALKIKKRLIEERAEEFEPDFLVLTLSALGDVYLKQYSLDNAKKFNQKATEIYQQLAKTDSIRFELDLAITLNKLGVNYINLNDFDKAENAFFSALNIYEKLAKKDSTRFESDLSIIHLNLGAIYYNLSRWDEAENAFFKSLEIYEKQGKTDENKNISIIATLQNNLGSIYSVKKDYEKALRKFDQSLINYKLLTDKDSENYDLEIARTIINKAYILFELKQLQNCYEEIVDARALLVNYPNNPFALELMDSCNELQEKTNPDYQTILLKVNPYLEQIDSSTNKVEKVHLQKEIIKIYSIAYQKRSENRIIKANLASSYGSLAWYQILAEDFVSAEESARKGLEVDPSQEWINANIALGLLFQGKIAKAKTLYAKMKNMPYDNNSSYRTVFLKDLEVLEKEGITCDGVKEIRELLKN